MKTNNKLLLFLLLLFSVNVTAQELPIESANLSPIPKGQEELEQHIAMFMGVHYMSHVYLEGGLAYLFSNMNPGSVLLNYGTGASVEYNPFNNRGAGIISAWLTFPFHLRLGTNIHSYTDFKKRNFGFKPYIGVGGNVISLTYGYNFQLVDNGVSDINTHCFSLRLYLPLIQTK